MKKTVLQYLIACYLFFFVTLLGLTALGFLVAGVYLYLGTFLTPWAAALAAGLVVLILALLFLILCWLVAGGSASRQAPEETSPPRENETLGMLLGLVQKSNISTKEASMIALLAGTVLGASPELRRKLFGGQDDDA